MQGKLKVGQSFVHTSLFTVQFFNTSMQLLLTTKQTKFMVKLVCSITNLISGRQESSNSSVVPSSILTVCWSLELPRRDFSQHLLQEERKH